MCLHPSSAVLPVLAVEVHEGCAAEAAEVGCTPIEPKPPGGMSEGRALCARMSAKSMVLGSPLTGGFPRIPKCPSTELPMLLVDSYQLFFFLGGGDAQPIKGVHEL